MAKSTKNSKKQSQPMSPTFKAGLIIIVVFFIVWGGISLQDSWYKTDPEPTNNQASIPIGTKEETQATQATQATTEVEQQVAQSQQEEPIVEEPVVQEPTTDESTSEDEQAQQPVILPNQPISSPTVVLNDQFNYDLDPMTFDGTKHSWSFKRNQDHTKVVGYSEGVPIKDYDAFFVSDTEEQVVYLTFDEGYENGYTSQILDTLAENNVKATFFVTEPYVRSEPELVKRMIEDGHIVGNHSVHHYDGSSGDGTALTEISSEVLIDELKGVEEAVLEETGYAIGMYFRPPAGLFSDRTLYVTRQQGYKTIFWSMAYADWNVNEQLGKDYAYDHVMTNYHPGAIILLHAVSESNTLALDDIIKGIRSEGYRFGSLDELPSAFQ